MFLSDEESLFLQKKDGFKQHSFKQPCLICFFAIFAEEKLHSAI